MGAALASLAAAMGWVLLGVVGALAVYAWTRPRGETVGWVVGSGQGVARLARPRVLVRRDILVEPDIPRVGLQVRLGVLRGRTFHHDEAQARSLAEALEGAAERADSYRRR